MHNYFCFTATGYIIDRSSYSNVTWLILLTLTVCVPYFQSSSSHCCPTCITLKLLKHINEQHWLKTGWDYLHYQTHTVVSAQCDWYCFHRCVIACVCVYVCHSWDNFYRYLEAVLSNLPYVFISVSLWTGICQHWSVTLVYLKSALLWWPHSNRLCGVFMDIKLSDGFYEYISFILIFYHITKTGQDWGPNL